MSNEILTYEMENQLAYVLDWVLDWVLWLDTRANTKKSEHKDIEMFNFKTDRDLIAYGWCLV